MSITDINTAWAVARITAARIHPFLGGFGYTLRLVPDERFPTAATDGKHIFYNPEWFMSLTHKQRVGLYLHECAHVVLLHPFRRKERASEIWNIACDYAINNLLVKDGVELPEGGCVDPTFEGLASEIIYERIKNNFKIVKFKISIGKPGKGEGTPDNNGEPIEGTGWGDVIDPEDGEGQALSPAEIKEIESEILGKIEQVRDQVKQIGTERGVHGGAIEGATEPEVPWKEALPRVFNAAMVPDDIDWRRIHRNYEDADIFVPNVAWTGSGTVVLGIDTSGSCSEEEKLAYITECEEILNVVMPNRTIVMGCTTVVHEETVQDLGRGEPIDRDIVYPVGGTDMREIFNWVENNDVNPDVLCIFTDGHTPYPDDEPDYPVIWVMTSDKRAPFGETIKLNTLD